MNRKCCDASQTNLYRKNIYKQVLRLPDTIAILLGLTFLVIGWITAWQGSNFSRWFYLMSAIVAGAPIVKGCFDSFWKRAITVEILVAIAIVSSLLIGEYHSGAIVAVMLLCGGVVEQLTVARAKQAIASLMSMVPQTALVKRDGAEMEIPLNQVRVGDRVIVKVGERVPVDGVILCGEPAIDESPITGESVPVDKRVGDKVFAGSINLYGVFELETQKVGEETTLGRIKRLVEEAQRSKAPIQRLANKYASWYVPTALAIAGLVWWFTGDVVRGITVLIVFCPCALVLATPTAIVASIGHAARKTILVKGGAFMEAVGQVNLVAFDKTGTLTVNKPTLTQVISLDGTDLTKLLQIAASVERFSEHPLGQAIRDSAKQMGLPFVEPSQFRSYLGLGVEAQIDGKRVLVGKLSWLGEQGVSLTENDKRRIKELEQKGHTVLSVGINGRLIGLLSICDSIRPEAGEVISSLKAKNINVAMVTGDNEWVANSIADEVNIDEVHANLLPDQKLQLVQEWKKKGHKVAFIGDGVNDAPALATADVGIAMGVSGSDVALETADIAFLNDDLTKMTEILEISRRTLRIIHQNIWFSVAINIASVIAAGKGWVNPVWGAFIHESSSMAVILNAMRLLR